VRGGGVGEREHLVDHDPQFACPDASDQVSPRSSSTTTKGNSRLNGLL